MWELVSGEPPFEKLQSLQIVRALDKGERPKIPPGVNPAYSELIVRGWSQLPSARPTFRELVAKLEAILVAEGGAVKPQLLKRASDSNSGGWKLGLTPPTTRKA